MNNPSYSAVTVDLTAKTATGANRVENVRNVTGGKAADTLTGDEFDNVLKGGDANDQLFGHAGKDTLVGGAGLDTADGGLDSDLDTALECETLVRIP